MGGAITMVAVRLAAVGGRLVPMPSTTAAVRVWVVPARATGIPPATMLTSPLAPIGREGVR